METTAAKLFQERFYAIVVRAAVVVALVEEILWRSFMARLVNDWEGQYSKRPFGEASWKSFGIVTVLFLLVQATVDYAGVFVYGSLTYLLCIWSKNLGACVVMRKRSTEPLYPTPARFR